MFLDVIELLVIMRRMSEMYLSLSGGLAQNLKLDAEQVVEP